MAKPNKKTGWVSSHTGGKPTATPIRPGMPVGGGKIGTKNAGKTTVTTSTDSK